MLARNSTDSAKHPSCQRESFPLPDGIFSRDQSLCFAQFQAAGKIQNQILTGTFASERQQPSQANRGVFSLLVFFVCLFFLGGEKMNFSCNDPAVEKHPVQSSLYKFVKTCVTCFSNLFWSTWHTCTIIMKHRGFNYAPNMKSDTDTLSCVSERKQLLRLKLQERSHNCTMRTTNDKTRLTEIEIHPQTTLACFHWPNCPPGRGYPWRNEWLGKAASPMYTELAFLSEMFGQKQREQHPAAQGRNCNSVFGNKCLSCHSSQPEFVADRGVTSGNAFWLKTGSADNFSIVGLVRSNIWQVGDSGANEKQLLCGAFVNVLSQF